MLRRCLILLGLMLALLSGQARADSCAVTQSDFVFPSVSSISSTDVFASATFKVTCTWTDFLGSLLTPNVTVCLVLGAGSNSSTTVTAPRQLGNGAVRVNYNIYTDATYAAGKIWGGWAGTSTASTPIVFQMVKSGGVGALSQNIPLYAKLTADSTLSSTAVGPTDLQVTSDFGTGSAVLQYQFSLTGLLGCLVPQTVVMPFQVRSTVINDCNINIGNLVFPDSKLLTGAVTSTASLSIRCSQNTAYRIVLSAGTNGASATARLMKNIGGPETISYQLSDTLNGSNWGDGTGGTTVVTGTGDGTTVTKTLYGRVPVQSTPSPGDYKDTITATVQF
ncbi:fimbrial major subunit CsuA/B family protein [Duganella sp. CY15W]|uniref:Csu type fimbrial protein n=1 Tax=Duganella sp. CY15W TaxID=2692172 RepID=UPI00136F8DDF|nr:spore coat U domain-containing protein [Duganella sp. CY15W]MYM28722.1 fimbrial major subunit CsuA/B family protein [Duganella sp. CY15W]